MTPEAIVAGLVVVLASGAMAALVTGLFNWRKSKVDVQGEIIEDLRNHVADLRERMTTVEKREVRKALLIEIMQVWMRRAYNLFTDDQKSIIGEPPTENDLPKEI